MYCVTWTAAGADPVDFVMTDPPLRNFLVFYIAGSWVLSNWKPVTASYFVYWLHDMWFSWHFFGSLSSSSQPWKERYNHDVTLYVFYILWFSSVGFTWQKVRKHLTAKPTLSSLFPTINKHKKAFIFRSRWSTTLTSTVFHHSRPGLFSPGLVFHLSSLLLDRWSDW